MKYMIVSDIHGDADRLDMLLEIYKAQNCKQLIILGDILYHGPRNDLPSGYNPKRAISLLNAMREEIIAVHGNCDAEVDQMVLDFPINESFKKIDLCGISAVLTHGHSYNSDNEPPCDYKILLHGHTHVQCIRALGADKVYINPGSISIPKGGNPASFIVADEEKIIIYDFDMNEIDRFVFSNSVN